MGGATFQVGEQKVQPGVFVRVTGSGEVTEVALAQGIVAALFRSSWGPLGTPVYLSNKEEVTTTFGSAGTVTVPQEAFLGGCNQVLGYRLGSGGEKASITLSDTTADNPVEAVRITALHAGVRGNDFTLTLRDSLTNGEERELLVFEGVTLRQTIAFAKGGQEAQALVTAVENSASLWLTATLLAEGNGILAPVTQMALAGGKDPEVTGESYSSGLSALEALDWNVLCLDTNDNVTHMVGQTYIDRVREDGKRVCVVLGEPTDVALNTRLSDAASFNDPAVIYVANGFKGGDNVQREGYLAAARVAGMVASADITDSLTHAVVKNAVEVTGALTNAQKRQATQSGALVFSMNARNQVQIEYGITTFITPTADFDAGWKKIRRMRTRDELINRIVYAWDPVIGTINNDSEGRATLVASAQQIMDKMVAEKALRQGSIFGEDPSHPAQGDSAWFVAQVYDNDSAEHVYIAFAFQFAEAMA